jgi:hypothetical protein
MITGLDPKSAIDMKTVPVLRLFLSSGAGGA